MHSVEAEITRAKNEAIRIRAEAGKSIVATVFRGVVPIAVCGIACGATAIILERADPSLHLVGLLIVWIAATLVSAATVLSGAVEAPRLNWTRLVGSQQPVQLEVNEVQKLRQSIQE
jgi:hypothetical protein